MKSLHSVIPAHEVSYQALADVVLGLQVHRKQIATLLYVMEMLQKSGSDGQSIGTVT